MGTSIRLAALATLAVAATSGCGNDAILGTTPLDPATAPRVSVDRFSATAGHLFVRTAGNGLPAANAPIDMDKAPFVTQGLGPNGKVVRYYNFDVMPAAPAPIYALFYEGSDTPVPNQLNIVDDIPGDADYSDFWQVIKVTVPSNYVANTATSLQDLIDAGFTMDTTDMLVNCPIVPAGSMADEGGGADGLVQGWFRDQIVSYFTFGEAALTTTSGGDVPTSPIFVTFNVNPDQAGGGPASGFMTEAGGVQTHNVIATTPGQTGYSPLWEVIPYDNAAFATVTNLATAMAATNFGTAALVNCPVVFVAP